MIKKQEFQEECRKRGIRLAKDDFYEKFIENPINKNSEIDNKFYEALSLLTTNPKDDKPTICKVFGVLNTNHNDDDVVKWLCSIGDRMGKRMYKKLVLRKRQMGEL